MKRKKVDNFFKYVFSNGWKDCVTPKIYDKKFESPITKNYKISICTTVMDRLKDIQLTLPKNIEDNIDYPNVEFVLLDYNSSQNEGRWVKESMREYIDKGTLNYYRTEEPQDYSMAHSRNIAFKLAQGEIVNNVDADNFTNKGFAEYVNKLANQVPEKAIFIKNKKMLRGRLGFYKEEFINLLSGYDETSIGRTYGHEDHDLLHRAWGLGFTMCWFGGDFYSPTPDHKKHQMDNFHNKDWKHTEKINKIISFYNLFYKRFKANKHSEWGKATVIKNFNEEIKV